MNYFLYTLLIISLFSCKNFEDEYKAEQAKVQLISDNINFLEEEQRLINGDYENAITTINEINDALNTIAENNKTIDQILLAQQNGLAPSLQIMEKLELLRIANKKASKNVSNLRAKARNYKVINVELGKMIEKLDNRYLTDSLKLDTLNSYIGTLRQSLDKIQGEIDSTDSELSDAYALLKVNTSQLERTNKNLQLTLDELNNRNKFIGDDAAGYVVCGTKKELRTEKILRLLSAKTLTKDYANIAKEKGTSFNYFEDMLIECSNGKAAYILPFRAPESYEIVNNKIKIIDKELFWETSKVVIVVKS